MNSFQLTDAALEIVSAVADQAFRTPLSDFVPVGEQVPLFAQCPYCALGYVSTLPCPCPACETPLTRLQDIPPAIHLMPVRAWPLWVRPLILGMRGCLALSGWSRRRNPRMAYLLGFAEQVRSAKQLR